jgi:ubiquinone/menaquinone biosynthesis C-methylase UbiE
MKFLDRMGLRKKRVCPVERAGSLDSRLRRWVQNPRKILGPYIKEGMTVLDFGCGPGYFTIDIAQMVGKSGRVIAADLQEGMLRKLKDKIKETELEERITLHKCEENRIGLLEEVDFVLAFYMVHEIPNQEEFFRAIDSILKQEGMLFLVEPLFHVSKAGFEETIKKARGTGLEPVQRPRILLSKSVILQKSGCGL